MADRSITVKIGANVSGFVSGMKTAAQATKDATEKADGWVQANKQGINDVSNLALGAGAALTGFALVAAGTAANFDASMSSVQAATMETTENMSLLREAAIEAGASTSFSATESAAAIEELAKAGVSTADILAGGLSGALDLAASDGMAVAEAAAIASAAMVQFGLDGADTAHIADLLAAGAGKALGSVSDLGGALNQSGLVAAQMGLSIEETTGALAMFAESGLVGSDAGTSFRSMLMRLAAPTKESAGLMKSLGINAYDAGGNFIGMEALAGQLETQLGSLTQEQKNSTLATIFGQDAIRAASITMENGAEGVRKWATAVDDQGYAADQARIKLDNLKGDLEGLGGSWETAMINMGTSADGTLRTVVQSASAVIDEFGKMPPAAQGASMALVGGGGLVALGVGGLGKLAIGISDARAAFDTFGTKGKAALVGVGGALAVATIAFGVWAKAQADARAQTEEFMGTLDELGRRTDETVRSINEDLAAPTGGWLEGVFGDNSSAIDQAEKMGIAVEDLTGYVLGQTDAVDSVNAAMNDYASKDLGNVWDPTEHTGQVDALRNQIDGLAGSLSNSEKQKLQEIEANKALGASEEDLAAATDVTRSAMAKYADEQAIGIASTEDYSSALEELIGLQKEAAGVVLSVREAQRGFEDATQGVTDALESQISELASQYEAQDMSAEAARARAEAEVAVADKLDITTEAGRRNQSALDDVASSGWDLIESMRANGSTQEELQASMQTTRDRFVASAEAMGMSSDEASVLADELGLIPSTIDVQVTSNIASIQETLDTFVAKYDGKTIATASVDVYERLISAGVAQGQAASGSRYTAQGLAWARSQGKAGGGPIVGPGSGTSDDVPIWASNGEWVIKQRSAAKYGRRMMSAINDGTFEPGRFANGGEVGWGNPRPMLGSASRAPVVNVAAPAFDVEYLARETARQMRLAAAGAGSAAYAGATTYTDDSIYGQAVLRT